MNLWHARERRGDAAVTIDDTQTARTFGHYHAPIGEKRERPGMLEALGNGIGADNSVDRRWIWRTRRLSLRQYWYG
jgi:hypothetical protein